MLKPESHTPRPKSNGSNSGKGKKNASPQPKSNKGKSKGTQGTSPDKSISTNPSNSTLFSMILDDGKNEMPHNGKADNNGEVSMENDTMHESRSGTKKHIEKINNVFGHRMYEDAAVIYAYFAGEIAASSLPKFHNEYQKRRAYSIAFAAKRCKKISC